MTKIKCELFKRLCLTQHRLAFLSLIFFFNQTIVFGQGSANDFDDYADKINLMISKALLAEKMYDVTNLVDGMRYDQFIHLIKLPENKQVAIDINDIKVQILQKYERSNLVGKLKEFFNSSVTKIPNQNNENRKKTITNLRLEFNKILADLESKLEPEIKSDIEADNKPKIQNVDDEAGNNMLDYILIGTAILLLIFCVVIFIKFITLNKDFQHIKFRFNEFERDQKATNQKYSEKQLNIFNQKRNDSALLSEIELERIKNIVFEDVLRKMNEVEYMQNRSADKVLNSTADYLIETKVNNYQIKFIETPEKDGYFDKNFLKNSEDIKSLYKILFFQDSNKIEFDILTDKTAIHRNAMDHSHIMLKPACEFTEEPSPNDKQIYKADSKPGSIELDNNKLVIIDKIKIKFG